MKNKFFGCLIRVVSEELNFMIYNLEILACSVHVYKTGKLMK